MIRIVNSFLALVLVSIMLQAPENSLNPTVIDKQNENYIDLLEPFFFSYEMGVGEAGMRPHYYDALFCLLRLDNAEEYLMSLIENANNEGKMYALCGLYRLNYGRFETLVETCSRMDEEDVLCAVGGCFLTYKNMAELMDGGEGSAYGDFRSGEIPRKLLDRLSKNIYLK